MLKIRTPVFHPHPRGLSVMWGASRRNYLSPRGIFRACKRIRKWWRHKEFCLFLWWGLPSCEDTTIPLIMAELCPWAQPERGRFQNLLREGVEVYCLGSMGRLPEDFLVFFFVLFDWYSGVDTLVKQTWIWGKTMSLCVIVEPEWRSATLTSYV